MVKSKLVGKTFGRLYVISENINNSKYIKWTCRCVCGNYVIAQSANLINGHTKSCGCLNIDNTKAANIIHNCTNTSEYTSWADMKQRCYNSKRNKFKIYGEKGVIVCDEWLNSFETFLKDMGKKPTTKHSLDRYPNPNGNYEPSNCRWATQKQQQGNRTNNRWIECNGLRMILEDWGRYLKVSSDAIAMRMKRGKTFKDCYNYYLSKHAKKQLQRNT